LCEMCVRVYVRMLHMCMRMHVCVWVCVCVFECKCVCMFVCACLCRQMCAGVYAHVSTCLHEQFVCVCVVCTHMHTYIDTYACFCAYIVCVRVGVGTHIDVSMPLTSRL
jgi:hypothetical protein